MTTPTATSNDLSGPEPGAGVRHGKRSLDRRGLELFMLVVLLAACGGERIWLAAHTEQVARDGVHYITLAMNLADQPVEAQKRTAYHPGYSYAIHNVHWMLARWLPEGLAGWEQAGAVVSIASSLAAMLLAYILARIWLPFPAAWIGLLLFGLGRKWASSGADVMSDSLALALQLMALYLAVVGLQELRKPAWRGVLCGSGVGMFAGFGYAVRGEAILTLAIAWLLWGIWAWRGRISPGKALTAALLSLAGWFAMASPYMTIIGGFTNKTIAGLDGAPVVPAPAVGGPAQAGLSELPAGLGLLIAQLFESLQPIVASLVVVWLILLACSRLSPRNQRAWLIRPRTLGRQMMLLVALIYGAAVIAHYAGTGFLTHRYVLPIAAVLAPLAGAAMVSTGRYLQRNSPAAAVRWARLFTPALTTVLAVVLVVHALRPIHTGRDEQRDLARALAGNVGATDLVLSNRLRVMYILRPGEWDLTTADLKAEPMADRLRFKPGAGYAWLVLSEAFVRRANKADPSLAEVLSSKAAERWPVSVQQPDDESPLLVWRIDVPAWRRQAPALTP